MRSLVSVLIFGFLVFVLGFGACGGCGDDKYVCYNVDGKAECHTFEQFGLFDAGKLENPNVEYDAVVGNVVWAVLLCETIVVPIVVVGWYLYEPVGPKNMDLVGVLGAKD